MHAESLFIQNTRNYSVDMVQNHKIFKKNDAADHLRWGFVQRSKIFFLFTNVKLSESFKKSSTIEMNIDTNIDLFLFN